MAVTATIETGKAKRKSFALFYLDNDVLELIGRGIEELSISQGANVTTVKDITGVTETSLDGYEKTTDLEPIYVRGGDKFSELLDTIEEQELTGDDVIKEFVVAKAYKKTADGKYSAWKQSAVVELTSFGGDTSGVQCPATLHWVGERTHGTFDPTTKTFAVETTAAEE